MKSIILCADDYGQNTAISQAIIELLGKNRLSATSCMVNSPYWLEHVKWLMPFKDQADIGLHFNLTEGRSVSGKLRFTSLFHLILKSYLRQLNQAAIEAEWHAQLDQFVAGMGQLPHFIDGHQHIHQLPVIRDALFKVYKERLEGSHCYVRSVYDPKIRWREGLKYFIIQLCGARFFKKALLKLAIPHNSSFAGIYHFSEANNYAAIFSAFLEKIEENGLIMCHPGLENSSAEDAIGNSRPVEYHYFASDQFITTCEAKKIQWGRLKSFT